MPSPPGAPPFLGMLAHSGPATPETMWDLGPATLAALLLSALGVGVLLRAACRPGTSSRRGPAGLVGLAVALGTSSVALLSPLHAAAESLFSAHMVQHLLLVAVVAPLLARAVPVLAPGLRLPERVGSWALPAATAALVVVFASWHVPALYEPAVRQPLVHGLEHVTMLTAATTYWLTITVATRHRVLAAVGAIAVSGLAGVALGALLALAPQPWYDVHTAGASAWGVDQLADQQLGGMIMWVPAGAANLAAAVLIVFRFLSRHDEAGGPPGVMPGALGQRPPPAATGPEVRR